MSKAEREAALLTALIQDVSGQPSDIFYATRQHEGKLVAGFWYRYFADESRSTWREFGFAGQDFATAKAFIEGLRK